MSHIVIHDDAEGVTHYHQFGDLDSAATYVERLRNRAGIEGARLFELHEVAFELKQYFKVEIGEPEPAPVVEMVSSPEVLPADEPDVVFETTSQPIETIGTVSAREDAEIDPDEDDDARLTSAGTETRRGLFGR